MKKVYVVKYYENVDTFLSEEDISIGSNVIISSAKGLQFGEVIKICCKEKCSKEARDIIRMANQDDIIMYERILKDNINILKYSRKLANDLKLKLKAVSVEESFDKKSLLLKFTSDSRIDFREYAKKLASRYRLKVELRQIGARDRSKQISGIGPCGQRLCCARFLNDMDSVSISMAKNQCLSLNPSKINGCCNRLMCCLSYEDRVYSENRKQLPRIGDTIIYKDKEVVVSSLNVINNKAVIYIDREKIEIDANECCKK